LALVLKFLHPNDFEMYPFKETGKLSKLFDMILRGHEQPPMGYDTPQNKFQGGIIPLGTNFCGVSALF
jgi:hypothetical protein